MLSFGGESANSYGTINNSVRSTDAILLGTLTHYKKLIKKLRKHQFNLPETGNAIKKAMDNFDSVPKPLKLSGRTLDFKKRTFIMGIVNVTPDSFSDGGKYFKAEDAIARAKEMVRAGADIIDIGGESTRPGAGPIPEKEEIKRTLPVIVALFKEKKCLISIDTRKSRVADIALRSGARIVNDISALRHDKKMVKVIAKHKAAVILMHMQGTPKNMQKAPNYDDVVSDIADFLEKSVEIAEKGGILSDHIMVDPGFGFGKTLEHNFELLYRLKELKVLGCPLLVGTSRKSMIGKMLNVPPEKRSIGTAATIAIAILNGANIIRVHDVKEMKEAAKIADAVIRRKS